MPSRFSWRQYPARPQPVSAVLAFDCAVSGQGVAVLRDGVTLVSLLEEGREQAARLLPAIADALDRAAIARRQLDLIAVTTGPGSFTGVRVGLSAARGLSVGLGIPLAGIPTTTVLRAQAPATDRLVVAAVDTKLGDWFCAIGAEPEAFATTAADLAARLAGRACLIVGKDVGPLVQSLRAADIDAIAHDGPPDPAVLGGLAESVGVEKWRRRNREEGLPRPLYLRGVNITLPDGARRTVE
ncbi:tRNA (adenosine(37)-N6)-threonylcarbamoyltransferase complex dimerization subunit type 1 TsaB [Reyranella aquatilis]|uniref:tRNA (Adenosine(37)-N6)-threonylcarbamoyltransferase complex dimerization subunit type 1 TsaB n=1 Tax=Reyranella aquatilis TaxID=2035356 RepID=A0ABS8KUN7_9HYPH|nr:tRNA (adenosine(37)-N6)-threonylcarbamoyltransferase complex dimerization subunit type 1 TsaB [Reyranella aquatilis]MCC8429785.1 tRNA (adenosine(37)-N6)-threonylcarbamoyltransferase complex dimerization subunit type 1 TsaB [Reyranella aquatilis]